MQNKKRKSNLKYGRKFVLAEPFLVFGLILVSLFFQGGSALGFSGQISAEKEDWQIVENPTFDVSLTGSQASFWRRIREYISPSDLKNKLKVEIISPDGKSSLLSEGGDFEIVGSSGDQRIVVMNQSLSVSGKYRLAVSMADDTEAFLQDFTWGVLAINFDQSSYDPLEKVKIGMAVLDDEGHTLCGAKISLEIVDPDQKKTVLLKEKGDIAVSEECADRNVTDKPDYFAAYVPQMLGTYQVKMLTETESGTKTLNDAFVVSKNEKFVIERVGSMRIYPLAEYVMKMNVRARENVVGIFEEKVPASFEVSDISSGGKMVVENDGTKKIVWSVDFKKGDLSQFYYTYDAPDVSPEFYRLGSAQIVEKEKVVFSENRQWQIASDALTTNNSSSNSGSAWTNPANAYGDGTNYANITSGSPSGSNVWGNYGFSLTGKTIDQVRVRYDALSEGVSSGATSQTARPTGDDQDTAGSTKSVGTTFYGVVDEAAADDLDFYTMATNGGGHVTMTFPAFTVPTDAVISDLTVYYRATNAGAANIRSSIKVGTAYFDTTDAGNDPSAWTTYSYAYTVNPVTGVAWTYDEINGTDIDTSHVLNAFGTASTDCNPDNQVSWVYAVVNYAPATEYDDQLKIDVSWDGGSSWSSTQNTVLTGSEVTTWYDVTSATAWTPAKLADGQLQVRALAQTVNNAEVVRLDWLPVEVTYSEAFAISGTSNVGTGTVVRVAVNNSLQAQTATVQGDTTWSITGVTPPSAGDIVTVFATNGGGNIAEASESTAIGKYVGAGDMTGMVLDANVLSIGGVGSQSISVSELINASYNYDNGDNEEVMHTANGTTLTVDGGNSYGAEKIDILAGDTFTVSGAETLATYDLAISGSLISSGNSAYNVAHNWNNGGSFASSTSTVTLNGSSTQTLSGTLDGTSAFYDLIITNNSGASASDDERTSFVASVDFNSPAKVSNNYVVATASIRVEYENGATYEFANIDWNGHAGGTNIFFRNSALSGAWLLKVTGTQTAVSFVNVSRCDASVAGGSQIVANDGTNHDGQYNVNWLWPVAGVTGGKNTFEGAANFQGSIVFQ